MYQRGRSPGRTTWRGGAAGLAKPYRRTSSESAPGEWLSLGMGTL